MLGEGFLLEVAEKAAFGGYAREQVTADYGLLAYDYLVAFAGFLDDYFPDVLRTQRVREQLIYQHMRTIHNDIIQLFRAHILNVLQGQNRKRMIQLAPNNTSKNPRHNFTHKYLLKIHGVGLLEQIRQVGGT